MKQLLTLVFTWAAFMLAANAVADDFVGNTNQFPKSTYSTANVDFNLQNVADQLGVSADSLVKALDAGDAVWSISWTTEAGVDTTSTTPTTSANGFWMDCNGTPVGWRNAPTHAEAGQPNWYSDFDWSLAEGRITALVGQYPNILQGGDEFTARFGLTLGSLTSYFVVNLSVTQRPELSTRKLADIQVLKTVETNVEQDARSNSAADAVTVEIPDVASLLGISDERLSEVFGFALHTNSFDATNDVLLDTLTQAANWESPGFSFGTYLDDETGEDSPHVVSGTPSAYNKFSITDVTYTDGKLSFQVSQVGNAMKSGDKYYADLYILNEGKAYVVRVNLTITDHIILTPALLTIVGEQSFVYEYNTDDSNAENYLASMSKTKYNIDMAAILAAFPEGTTADDLVFMATYDTETNELLDRDAIVSSGYHSSNGVYMTWEGTLCAWGASGIAAKIGYNSGASFDFAYVPSSPDDGSHLVKSIYLVYQNKYAYEFKFDITLHSSAAEPVYVAITNPQDHIDADKTIYTFDEESGTYTAATSIEEGVQYYVLQEDYIEPKPVYTFDTCEEVDAVEIDVDLVLCESSRTLSRYKYVNGVKTDESDKRNVVTDLGQEYLEQTIGTSIPAIYVAVKGTDAAGNDSIYYQEAHGSIGSETLPGQTYGAWIYKDGYFGSYTLESPLGFSVYNYQMEWWKHNAWTSDTFYEGEENTVHFYAVNLQTGKKVKYTFHITWVSTLSTAEVVGSEELILGTRGDGDNEYVLDFDISGVAEKLGATVEELDEAGTWYVPGKTGRPVAATDGSYYYDELDGMKLNQDGQIIAEDESDLVFNINFDFASQQFITYVIDDSRADGTYLTTLYLDYNGKRYQFDIVVTPDPDTYVPTAISSIGNTQPAIDNVYNLQGQKLSAPQRGINIVGGRKVLVK